MTDRDLKELRALLRDAVVASRLSNRDVEEVLGIGHGTLERLLNGTLDLRVRHILALARYLKVSPADFFSLGCPQAVRAAEHDLSEWLSPPRRRQAEKDADLSRNPDELAKLVRAAVQEELANLRRSSNGG
ncbi:MAG TPA: helix-turn-helix transcriptional regulator [Thermoanaerobaculia bacterium]|nr:helix-turn-helix transcriptional regulator [Thermoanaerobaculia bacterium]